MQSAKKNKKMLLICIGSVFLLTASILFGIYDFDISNAIVNKNSTFGLTMELSGMLVAPYLFMAAGFIIALYYIKVPKCSYRRTKITLGFIFVSGGIGFCSYIYLKFPRWLTLWAFIITVAAFAAFVLYLKKMTSDELYELWKISIVTIVYLLSVLIVINIIKVFWGRVRFRQLEDPSQFTRWFLPQGITGFRSFPSGHTANAATLYVMTMFAPLKRKKWQKALFYIIPILWIIVMASSRVIVGAHYASDVLFGALISILIFYITKNIVLKKLGAYYEKV